MLIVTYIPLSNELKAEINSDFIKETSISKEVLSSYFDGIKNSALSVSNRLILKQKINEFDKGDLTFEELEAIHAQMYPVAIKDIDNLYDITRVVDGKCLYPFEYDNCKEDFLNLLESNELAIELKKYNDKYRIVISSPIIFKGEILGHDISIFSIDEFMNQLNEGRISYNLITNTGLDSLNNIEYNSLTNIDDQLFYVHHFSEIKGGLVSKIDSESLYGNINRTQKSIFIYILIIFIVAVLLIHITIVKKADTLLLQLDYISFHDKLTGLYNRRFYENEIKRLNNTRKVPLAIIIGDIDGLKQINDNYGHKMGDKYIKKTGEIFDLATRNEDVVSRIGGDEFAAVLPNTDGDATRKLCNRINSLCKKINDTDELPESLEISLGYEIMNDVNQDLNNIFEKADQKMYKNKKKRKTN